MTRPAAHLYKVWFNGTENSRGRRGTYVWANDDAHLRERAATFYLANEGDLVLSHFELADEDILSRSDEVAAMRER